MAQYGKTVQQMVDKKDKVLTDGQRLKKEAVERAGGRKIIAIICGLPSSGNRLVQYYLHRAGAVESLVLHGLEPQIPKFKGRHPDHEVYAIMMVRDNVCWERSVTSHHEKREEETWADYADRCYVETMKRIVEYEIPFRAVSYEGLLRNYQAIGDYLCDWMRLPRLEWPDEDDGACPWKNHPQGDPNEKWMDHAVQV
jgi:hypothetical protein